MKHILIVTTATAMRNNQATIDTFSRGINTGESTFEYAPIQQLKFAIRDGVLSLALNGTEVAGAYDAIHLRNHDRYTDYANALRVYCDAHGIHLVNRADATLPYFGKLSQGALLATNNIPTPDLVTMFGNAELAQELSKDGYDYPIVIKHNLGMKGTDNYLVRDKQQMQDILKSDNHGYVMQPFIPNKGELRVLTFGTQLDPLVFRKTAAEGAYLNNTSKGGEATQVALADIEPEVIQDAMKAAELMGREIAGVDVLLALDGTHTILEANTTPAIASGAYLADKQALYRQYFEKLNGASV